jgi:hypothetical protein
MEIMDGCCGYMCINIGTGGSHWLLCLYFKEKGNTER